MSKPDARQGLCQLIRRACLLVVLCASPSKHSRFSGAGLEALFRHAHNPPPAAPGHALERNLTGSSNIGSISGVSVGLCVGVSAQRIRKWLVEHF
jgi:ribosomal protein L36